MLAKLSDEDMEVMVGEAVRKLASGDVAALKEVTDRVEGRVPQSVVGGDDDDNPIKIETIRRIIVRPGHSDGGSVPPAADAG